MRNKKSLLIFITLFILLGLYLSGSSLVESKKPVNKVYIYDDVNKAIDTYVSQSLPKFRKEKLEFFNSSEFIVDKEVLAFQAFDFQYENYNKLLPGSKWQPLQETTCLIAVNKSRVPDNILIHNYQDILKNDLKLGWIKQSGINALFNFSIHTALDFEPNNIDHSLAFLKKIYDHNNLYHVDTISQLREHWSEIDVALVLSHQRDYLKEMYPETTFIVPQEGSIKYLMGIINQKGVNMQSPRKITVDSLDDVNVFGNISEVESSDQFLKIQHLHDFLFRREVLKIRLYSPINFFTTMITYFTFSVLAIIWSFSLYLRMVNRNAKMMILIFAALMFFWQLIMAIKRITFSPTITIYAWYLYYVPILFLPIILLHLLYSESLKSGKTQSHLNLLSTISVFLLIIIITNNFHQLIFKFPSNTLLYVMDIDYSYNYLFFAVIAFVVLAYFFMSIRVLKIAKKIPNKYRLLPFIGVVLLYLTYSVGYISGFTFFRQSDFGLTVYFIYFLLIESWYFAGFFPGSIHYKKIFKKSLLNLMILDKSKKMIFKTKAQIPEIVNSAIATLKQKPKQFYDWDINERYLISLQPIRGGYVYWWKDILEQKQLQRELNLISDQLASDNSLLKNREIIEGKMWETKWLAEIYADLAVDLEKELRDVEQDFRMLVTDQEDCFGLESKSSANIEIEKCSEEYELNQQLAFDDLAFSASILKRKANLLLLGEIMSKIPLNELIIAIEEIFVQLEIKFNILYSNFKGIQLKLQDAIVLYELFAQIGKNIKGSSIEEINLIMTLSQKQIKFTLYFDKYFEPVFSENLLLQVKQRQIVILNNPAEELDETVISITNTIFGKVE